MAKENTTVVYVPGETHYINQPVVREVHEHRAPTDASVALLMEMEQAARAKIEKTLVVFDNVMTCTIYTEHDNATDSMLAKAVFTINGKQLSAQVAGHSGDHSVSLALRLRDEVARVVATEMLAQVWNNKLCL